MSNSRWRVVGYARDGLPYSNSGHTREAALEIAEMQKARGHFPIAVMPESESAIVSGTNFKKERSFAANMEKALLNPEWLFPDPIEAEELYKKWKRLNGYASAGQTITIGPRKPKPQLPPEVWRVKPEIDKTDYMAAVRAMCGEGRKGE